MIPNVVQQVEDVEIPPLLVSPRLGNGAFQLWAFMMKPPETLYYQMISNILIINIAEQDQLKKEHSEDWKASLEMFFLNVKVIRKLPNYMA